MLSRDVIAYFEIMNGTQPKIKPDHVNDDMLVARVLDGDRKAFDILVLKYQNKLATLISRFLKNEADILDIVQESFVKAYRSLETFRGESLFYTWLSKIAVNTAKNFITSNERKVSQLTYSSDLSNETNSEKILFRDSERPDENASADQLRQAIFASIDKLPTRWSAALKLREVDGMSYEQIAGVMNCPVGTVRSRIFRARETILKDIKPAFPGTFFKQ